MKYEKTLYNFFSQSLTIDIAAASDKIIHFLAYLESFSKHYNKIYIH